MGGLGARPPDPAARWQVTYAKIEHLPLVVGWDAYDWEQVLGFKTMGDEIVTLEMIDQVHAMYSSDPEDKYHGYYDTDLAALMVLNDGRWATLHAGNDTTGWGCHGDYIHWRIFATRAEAISQGLTNESRRWLKLELDDEVDA